MKYFEPKSEEALGMIRAGVHGVFLVSILNLSPAELGRLPVTILHPIDIMKLFSWRLYDRLLTPGGMSALKWFMVLSLLASTIGYLTPLTTKTSALLVIFYQGLLRSFGHFNHDEIVGIYFLIVLAFTPCGDGFSLDALANDRSRRLHQAYGYPILLMQLILAWFYFTAGLTKLRISGLAWFRPDNLPIQAIHHSLDNLHDTQYRLAFWLPQLRQYLPLFLVVVTAWEILFPLAVFCRRSRLWFLGFGVVFHVGTMLMMNVFFPHWLAMYLIFVDWPALWSGLSRRPLLRSLCAWWRNLRSIPESFPGVSTQIGGKGTLLWDGNCGFCASMVRSLKRAGRRPFADQPFQTLASRLPAEVLQFSNRQMHWVDESGSVVGGSRALIEVLDASGHRLTASVLDSPVCKPITWLAYRLVSSNRSLLRSAGEKNCKLNKD